MKRLGYGYSICLIFGLMALFTAAIRGESLSSLVEAAKCSGTPVESVDTRVTDSYFQFDIQPNESSIAISVIFHQVVSLAGKERLIIEGRGVEPSGEGITISQISLLDAAGGEGALYEPDLRLPPEWNQRAVLLRDFEGKLPNTVSDVEIHLWVPGGSGKKMFLRRCEFLSTSDVAKSLSYISAPSSPVLALGDPRKADLKSVPAPQALPISEKYRRWTNFGPGGGGWYRVVAISPHNGDCFVGADVGGVYRSTDNCQTWSILNAGMPNTYINAIAFHPDDERIMFAGCNGGVLKSTDGGVNWSIKREGFPPLLTFGQSAPVSAIAINPEEPNLVYAGVGHERNYGALSDHTIGGRIFKSADGGETWKMIKLPGGEETRKLSVLCIRFHPDDTRRMYASTQQGLFSSADGGESWERLGQVSGRRLRGRNQDQGLDGYETTFLVIKKDRPDTMLLAYSRSQDHHPRYDAIAKVQRGGVLKSMDGGATWEPSNNGLPEREEAWRIIADPNDSNTYYLGWHRRSGLFITHDCGNTWEPLNMEGNIKSAWFFEGHNVTGIDVDPENPRRLVYCNDMDLYQTLDGGKTWNQVATDLVRPATAENPAVWQGRGCEVICAGGPQALAVDPTNPQTLYFGYMDVHSWKSDDGGRTCYRLTNGISSGYGRMGAVVLDPADPNIVYLSKGRNYDQHRIYKSINAGVEFHLMGHEGSGLPPGGIFNIIIDPSSPIEHRVIYATVTGYGIYKSENGGLSWHEQSNGLPADSRVPMQLAIDQKQPQRLFLASGAHYHRNTRRRVPGYIARTVDGGEHWEVIKTKIEPQCIVIDPFDSQKIYVGNRNFSGVDYPNAFYKTLDGGDTWTEMDQAPFLRGPGSHDGDQDVRVYVSCLAADPSTPGVLYAACTEESYDISNGRGVFRSTDWGETWEPFVHTGLTVYRVRTLVVDPVNSSRLYAGTGGNGFFRFGPPPDNKH